MSVNIGTRILLAASLIVVAVLAGFILFFDINQRQAIQNTVESKVADSANLAVQGIANWMDGRRLLIENVGDNVTQAADAAAIQAVVDRPVLQRTFEFTYFGGADGAMIISPPSDLPSDYDPRQRPWYKDASAARATTLTEPYEDASTKELVVTVTTPVLRGSTLAGVVGGDMTITALGDLVRSVDLGGLGYAFLVSAEGTVLIHPDAAQTLKPMAEVFVGAAPEIRSALGTLSQGDERMFTFYRVEGLPSVEWYLGFSIDRDAAFASLQTFRISALVAVVVAVLAIIGLLGVMIRYTVSRPILAMTDAMTGLARGDLSVGVPGQDRKDEIGSMAGAVEVFKANALEVKRLEEDQVRQAEAARRDRRAALDQMADSFERTVLSIVESVANTSRGNQTVAESLTRAAEETANRLHTVSNATNDTTDNVNTVAAATEELSAAIDEINSQVNQSIQITSGAVDAVQQTSATVGELADSAQRIGRVINLIKDVAGQTNLLALNATIEAARAGEAGKGFAVVATEVKTLADTTDKATGDIQVQIDGIQNSSTRSVDEIGQITGRINQVSEFASAIAAAINQQGAATREIANSVARAAEGTRQVAENVSAVDKSSADVRDQAQTLLTSSSEMSALADKLRHEVSRFLETVRSSDSKA